MNKAGTLRSIIILNDIINEFIFKEVLLELQKLVGVVENGLEKNLADSTN